MYCIVSDKMILIYKNREKFVSILLFVDVISFLLFLLIDKFNNVVIVCFWVFWLGDCNNFIRGGIVFCLVM